MIIQELMLRQQKRTVGAELDRCDRLLSQITTSVAGVHIHHRPLWYDELYRWELRDSAPTPWAGAVTLDALEMMQVSRMADDELRNVLEAKLGAVKRPE